MATEHSTDPNAIERIAKNTVMHQLSILGGVIHYEYRMQIRRKALWITFACFLLFLAALVLSNAGSQLYQSLLHLNRYPILTPVVIWTGIVNYIFPIAIGCLLADRLPRDKRTRVDELFSAMPGAMSTRLVGKFLGCTLAALTPLAIIYAAGLGVILYQTQNLMALPLGLATFAAIVLPGNFFIGAFSIACPAIIWVPLYQFLFVGYWFWGNLLPAGRGIPTLSGTILTPAGGYASSGFFGSSLTQIQQATAMQGVESIFLLLALASFVMILLWSLLKWQQAR